MLSLQSLPPESSKCLMTTKKPQNHVADASHMRQSWKVIYILTTTLWLSLLVSLAAAAKHQTKQTERSGSHRKLLPAHYKRNTGVLGLGFVPSVTQPLYSVDTYNLKWRPTLPLTSSRRSLLQMMPIGIPKVAYRLPGSSTAEWIDIYNRLYRERIIFLSQELDDEFANQVIGIMLYLDSEDSSKPIYLYINCPGGSVISGLAIYDTMQHIKSEVVTINVGLAASMASFLLAGGTKGKRLALPHSRTMMHQPSGGAEGPAEEIKVEAAQILRVQKDIVNMYSKMTGKSPEKVAADLNRDKFMSAEEAKEYGLIDHVIELKSDEAVLGK